MLSKVRVGNTDDDLENLLKAWFIHESEPAMKRNEAVLNYLLEGLYTVWDNNKISNNGK